MSPGKPDRDARDRRLEVDVLCAVRGPHEERFAQGLDSPRGAVRIVRRCADLAELVAVASAGVGHIAMVSHDQTGLDREAVAELHSYGVDVVALVEDPTGWQSDRGWALGADAVVPLGIEIDDLADLLLRTVRAPGEAGTFTADRPGEPPGGSGVVVDGEPAGDRVGEAVGEANDEGIDHMRMGVGGSAGPGVEPAQQHPGSLHATPPHGQVPRVKAVGGAWAARVTGLRLGAASLEPAPVDTHNRRGQIIVVWGPGGAPGRTSLAINLATELAADAPKPTRVDRAVRVSGGTRPAAADGLPMAGPTDRSTDVLLVDADTYNPSLAQHLALLDEAAGLVLAARAASQGLLDVFRLAELSPRIDRRLRVLTGIGRPTRWPEVPASSLEAVWDIARRLADLTVIDSGAVIERDEALSYDTRAPQRNGAATSALEAADVVIIVANADPVGVQRLVRGMGDLMEAGLALSAQQVVVVNRVRAGVVGGKPLATLQDALWRHAGLRVAEFIPEQADDFDSALLAGRTLAEMAPHSPARRAIADLAARVRQLQVMGVPSG